METTQFQPARKGQRGCSGPAVYFAAWSWAAFVVLGRILTGILLPFIGLPGAERAAFWLALGQAFLLAGPFMVISFLPFPVVYQKVLRTWGMAALFAAAAAPIHLSRPFDTQLHAVLHVAASVIFISLAWLIASRPGKHSTRGDSRGSLLGLIFAAVFALPWLAWGALGSLLDTVLQTLAALALGLAAALTLELFLFPALLDQRAEDPSGELSCPSFFFVGTSTAVTLLIFYSGTGFGYHGMQLLLMISLPPLSFALLRLRLLRIQLIEDEGSRAEDQVSSRLRPDRYLPAVLLLSLAAAAPMNLVDPAELIPSVSLGRGELLQWAFSAALVSAFLALAAGMISMFIPLPDRHRSLPGQMSPFPMTSQPLTALSGFVLLSALAVYFLLGQPGFHGDGLFIIMENQYDTSQAHQISDIGERRSFIYHTLVEHALLEQADLHHSLNRFNIDYTPYYLVNGLEVSGGPLLGLWLNSQPGVGQVLKNPWMRPLPIERPPAIGQAALPTGLLWNLNLVKANQAWEEFGAIGEGIVIGHADTGVQVDHPELMSSYRGYAGHTGEFDHNYNWYDPWFGRPIPVDISGHGTHTLGSILGRQVGVAPGASWIACANLSRNQANPALYLDCLQFLLAPFPIGGSPFFDGDPALGVHVINNSWSCPDFEGCDSETLLPAVRALRAAGIFLVASAGNDGPGCESLSDPPAIYSEVFSVAAIDSQGELAAFSSIGPVTSDGSDRIKPDLAAPGLNVLSAMPGSSYAANSGTSMAGPHVTGVVALMWSANPDLIGDIDRTEQILRESAAPYTGWLPACPFSDGIPSTAVGYGILDAHRAVELALEE
jgi:hypothetical protein